MSKRLGLMICGGGLVLALAVEQSGAQVVITPGAVRADSRGGAAGGRSPGLMVSDGLARARGIEPRPLAAIEITETDATSARSQLIADLLQTVFEDLNLAIVGFHNALLARAGRPPVIPVSLFQSPNNTGGTPAIDLGDAASLLDQFADFLPQGNAGN
jgi:hypothetical protein